MAGFSFKCAWCGKRCVVHTRTRGTYCGRKHFGLARRKNRTIWEKKEIKRLYDIDFRRKNRARLKREKAAYHARVHKRVAAKMKKVRQTPEYKRRMRAYLEKYWDHPVRLETKADYDRRWRARRDYGKLWELKYLTVLINKEVKARMTNYELRLQNGTLNKAMNRGRNGEVKRGYT